MGASATGTRAAVLQRLQEQNTVNLIGHFGFTYTLKKRFPYLKIDDSLAYMVEDILERDGFSLTRSIMIQDPGKIF